MLSPKHDVEISFLPGGAVNTRMHQRVFCQSTQNKCYDCSHNTGCLFISPSSPPSTWRCSHLHAGREPAPLCPPRLSDSFRGRVDAHVHGAWGACKSIPTYCCSSTSARREGAPGAPPPPAARNRCWWSKLLFWGPEGDLKLQEEMFRLHI